MEHYSIKPLSSVLISEKEVIITADMPCVDPSSISVRILKEDLVGISARIKDRVCLKDFGITHREGTFDGYHDQIHIPVEVDAKRKPVVRCVKGILEVRVVRKYPSEL